ncbi:MAG: isoprenylcysteine carboxyl methyltransferase family protein [Alphaproteobacteria bacterium]
MIAYLIIGAVVLQRLLELVYAGRNTKRLLAIGAVEVGRGHYPFIVLLHAAWFVAIILALPQPITVDWVLFALFLALQAARIWIIATLGPYWTTRIITLPNAPLVRKGPYRVMRHPNYAVVAAEFAVFPLVFGEIWVAVFFSIANAALLWWRIQEEDRALAPRRNANPV